LNNYRMAASYMRQAKERLKHAGEALEGGNYAYVVRQSQEAVELALKAALRLMGIEPPRWHDVGPVLRRSASHFPPWFREHVGRLARISRQLAHEREFSMYGDEELGLPPDDIYGREDATWALEQARFVVGMVEKLLEEAGAGGA